jgi:hypothetical protein
MALQQASGPPQRDVRRGDLVRHGDTFARVRVGSGGTKNPVFAGIPWIVYEFDPEQVVQPVSLQELSVCCRHCRLLEHSGSCPTGVK